MNLQERRACIAWTIATAVVAAVVFVLYLVDVRVAAWASIGIAAGVAVSRTWARSTNRSDA
jgi:hypothetical protein